MGDSVHEPVHGRGAVSDYPVTVCNVAESISVDGHRVLRLGQGTLASRVVPALQLLGLHGVLGIVPQRLALLLIGVTGRGARSGHQPRSPGRRGRGQYPELIRELYEYIRY